MSMQRLILRAFSNFEIIFSLISITTLSISLPNAERQGTGYLVSNCSRRLLNSELSTMLLGTLELAAKTASFLVIFL